MKYFDKLIFVLIEVLSDGTNLETMFESPKAYQLYTFLDSKRKRLETVAYKCTCFITTKPNIPITISYLVTDIA